MLQSTENNIVSVPRTAMNTVLQNINYLGEIFSYLDWTDLLQINLIVPKHIRMSPAYVWQLNQVWEQLFHIYFPDHQYYISDLKNKYKQVFKEVYLDWIDIVMRQPELILSLPAERQWDIIKMARKNHNIHTLVRNHELAIYNNKEKMLFLLKRDYTFLRSASDALCVDRDIVRCAVKQNMRAIPQIPHTFQYFNEDIVPLMIESPEGILDLAASIDLKREFINLEKFINPATNKMFLHLHLFQSIPPGICTILAAAKLFSNNVEAMLKTVMHYRAKFGLLPLPYCNNPDMLHFFIKNTNVRAYYPITDAMDEWMQKYIIYQQNFGNYIWQYRALNVLRIIIGIPTTLLGLALSLATSVLLPFACIRGIIGIIPLTIFALCLALCAFGGIHMCLATEHDQKVRHLLSNRRDEFKSAYLLPNYVEQQCELLIVRLRCDKSPTAQAKGTLLEQVYQKALQSLPEQLAGQAITVEQRQVLLKNALAQKFDIDNLSLVIPKQASFASIAAESRSSHYSIFRAKTTTTKHLDKLLAYTPA